MKQNNVISILLSVIIAACLWAYVVTSVNPEDSRWFNNISVTFDGEDGLFSDRNLTLTSGRDFTVNLHCVGNRQELQKLTNQNITISVDLTQVTGPGEWSLPYEFSFPDNVNDESISVDSRSSYRVDILVDKLAVKEIEVRARLQGTVAESYVQEPIELEHQTLVISGPQEQVDLIDHALVVIARENVNKTVSDTLTYTFVDAEDNPVEVTEVKCDVEKIGVLMPVSMVKEIPLIPTLVAGGGADEDHAIATVTPATVTIKGDAAELEVLNFIAVGPVDLSKVQDSYSGEFSIGVPNGMENLTETVATVNVELKNLRERSFRVTNLETSNVPEGLTATIGTISLQVKLRGDTTVMESITTSNIRAVADLSSLGNAVGQFSVPATIYVDGYAEVGARGTYSMLVTLAEQVEAAAVTVAPSIGEVAETEETEAAAAEGSAEEESGADASDSATHATAEDGSKEPTE